MAGDSEDRKDSANPKSSAYYNIVKYAPPLALGAATALLTGTDMNHQPSLQRVGDLQALQSQGSAQIANYEVRPPTQPSNAASRNFQRYTPSSPVKLYADPSVPMDSKYSYNEVDQTMKQKVANMNEIRLQNIRDAESGDLPTTKFLDFRREIPNLDSCDKAIEYMEINMKDTPEDGDLLLARSNAAWEWLQTFFRKSKEMTLANKFENVEKLVKFEQRIGNNHNFSGFRWENVMNLYVLYKRDTLGLLRATSYGRGELRIAINKMINWLRYSMDEDANLHLKKAQVDVAQVDVARLFLASFIQHVGIEIADEAAILDSRDELNTLFYIVNSKKIEPIEMKMSGDKIPSISNLKTLTNEIRQVQTLSVLDVLAHKPNVNMRQLIDDIELASKSVSIHMVDEPSGGSESYEIINAIKDVIKSNFDGNYRMGDADTLVTILQKFMKRRDDLHEFAKRLCNTVMEEMKRSFSNDLVSFDDLVNAKTMEAFLKSLHRNSRCVIS